MALIDRYLLVDFQYISGFDFCFFLLYPQNILYTKTPISILWGDDWALWLRSCRFGVWFLQL